jgi:hypothetical protein
LSAWRDAGAITSLLDPTGAAITAFGASVGVGGPGRQIGGPGRPDRRLRGYPRYHGVGCHAKGRRSAGLAWPQYGGPAELARVRPATPGDRPGPGRDRLSGATWIRQRLYCRPKAAERQHPAVVSDRPSTKP